MCVCVEYLHYSISHDTAYLSRQEVVVIINGSVNLFAAVQVQFDPQNYTVTEGDGVNITLVTNTSDYEFDFNVILFFFDESATCKFCGGIPAGFGACATKTCTIDVLLLWTVHIFLAAADDPCRYIYCGGRACNNVTGACVCPGGREGRYCEYKKGGEAPTHAAYPLH